LFGALSLIKRDPSFGLKESNQYLNRYGAPVFEINHSKIQLILPMLYLYKFDPITIVQEVMKNLWEKLIPKEKQKILMLSNQSIVIDYLAKMLSSKLWKEREAACTALESFLPQRDWKIIQPSFLLLWNNGLKVLDDVRMSTRMSSLNFMKVFFLLKINFIA
jgi:proteasome component ECM29